MLFPWNVYLFGCMGFSELTEVKKTSTRVQSMFEAVFNTVAVATVHLHLNTTTVCRHRRHCRNTFSHHVCKHPPTHNLYSQPYLFVRSEWKATCAACHPKAPNFQYEVDEVSLQFAIRLVAPPAEKKVNETPSSTKQEKQNRQPNDHSEDDVDDYGDNAEGEGGGGALVGNVIAGLAVVSQSENRENCKKRLWLAPSGASQACMCVFFCHFS